MTHTASGVWPRVPKTPAEVGEGEMFDELQLHTRRWAGAQIVQVREAPPPPNTNDLQVLELKKKAGDMVNASLLSSELLHQHVVWNRKTLQT